MEFKLFLFLYLFSFYLVRRKLRDTAYYNYYCTQTTVSKWVTNKTYKIKMRPYSTSVFLFLYQIMYCVNVWWMMIARYVHFYKIYFFFYSFCTACKLVSIFPKHSSVDLALVNSCASYMMLVLPETLFTRVFKISPRGPHFSAVIAA